MLRGSHGWNWPVSKEVDLDHFPLLDSQLLFGDVALEPSNCNALILDSHILSWVHPPPAGSGTLVDGFIPASPSG